VSCFPSAVSSPCITLCSSARLIHSRFPPPSGANSTNRSFTDEAVELVIYSISLLPPHIIVNSSERGFAFSGGARGSTTG